MISKKEIEILKKEFNLNLDDEIILKFNLWEKIFTQYNCHTNLMSKNDILQLFEKHVFDSLAILKWDKFFDSSSKNPDKKVILDVGTGGGFPSVILAIALFNNPDFKIIANDSRIKKINFIKEIKEKLNLENLEILYSRIEEVEPLNVDLIVSRAVGKMKNVWELSKKHLKNKGFFAIYKSKLTNEEIKEFNFKDGSNFEIINYNLPLSEIYERNLIIFQN